MRLLALLLACLLAAPAWADTTREQAVHHQIDLRLDPARGAIELSDQIHITGAGRTAFALSPAFVVKTLSVDGQAQPAARTDGGVLIDLGSAGTHEIHLAIAANLTSRAQSGQSPRPPFLTAEGGFLGPEWLPHPPDRLATWAIDGETPLRQKWLAPGRLTRESEDAGTYRASYTETQPSPPPLLLSGPFEVAERMLGEVRIRTYFHTELSPLAEGYLQDTARYIERYAQQVGPYPYDGFSIVSGPAPVGLGLPGMTYMGRRVLALPFIRTSSLPHEVLHNWWGNAVEVDYASGNWAEGLTTFMADYAIARQNPDGGRDMRLEWLRNYAALPIERDQALTEFVSKTHDATQVVGYGKTAYVFHMLWRAFGPDVFDRALQTFYQDNQAKRAGWRDIQAAFEAASSKDLSAFFNAWITRPGAPQLALKDAQAVGTKLTFTLIQTQDGPAYPLSVPLDVRTSDQGQRLRVRMTEKAQTFTVNAKAEITALFVDPDFDLFRRLSPGEAPAIFRDVTLSPDTRLIAPGDNAEAQAIVRAMAQRLLQRDVRETAATPSVPLRGANIIAGLESDVRRYLDQIGFGALPHELRAGPEGHIEGMAYVMREGSDRTTLVVMARDIASLTQLARRLPHYKSRSFIVQDQGRVTRKGVWPTRSRALSASFNITPQ